MEGGKLPGTAASATYNKILHTALLDSAGPSAALYKRYIKVKRLAKVWSVNP